MTVPTRPRALGRAAVVALAGQLGGRVVLPDDSGYEHERAGFNRAVVQRPALIVRASGAADCLRAVRFAASHGLPVGVQATGHGLAQPADGSLLLVTGDLTELRVDPATRTARVGAGVPWDRVLHEAGAFGLAPLSGSCPRVGAVSYTLGGGIGPISRKFGYAADHVRAVDLVTVTGEFLQVTPQSHPELFWGLRGGKGNFGVATSIEIDLMPLPEVYGGGRYHRGTFATEVLRTWLEWTAAVPDAMTSSVALLALPDIPAVPMDLRGGPVVHVRVAYAGSPDEGARLVRPLSAAPGCVLDTLTRMPAQQIGAIHGDPVEARAFCGDNVLLRHLDAHAVDALWDAAGEEVSAGRMVVEIRHLGGALARRVDPSNAVGHRDAAYVASVVSDVVTGGWERLRSTQRRVLERLAPWSAGGKLLNFIDGPTSWADVRTAFEPHDYARLRRLKAVHDPENRFRFNHNIPPADG